MKLGLGILIVGAAGLVYGVVFGQVVGFLVFFIIHLRSNGRKARWIRLGEMGRLAREYSLFPRYNMMQGLINNLAGALPVFVFSSYFSLAIAGLYTFGYMVIYRPVNLVASSFYQVLYQRFVERQHGEKPILPEVLLFLRRTSQWLVVPFVVFGIFAPDIFAFLFDDRWMEAGKYARIMLPWIFMVSLVMPLSFIPDLYRRQGTAMLIDGVRLVLRLAGLTVGVVLKDEYLALGLFTAASTLGMLYSLLWYIRLVKKHAPVINKEEDGKGS